MPGVAPGAAAQALPLLRNGGVPPGQSGEKLLGNEAGQEIVIPAGSLAPAAQ